MEDDRELSIGDRDTQFWINSVGGDGNAETFSMTRIDRATGVKAKTRIPKAHLEAIRRAAVESAERVFAENAAKLVLVKNARGVSEIDVAKVARIGGMGKPT